MLRFTQGSLKFYFEFIDTKFATLARVTLHYILKNYYYLIIAKRRSFRRLPEDHH